MPYKLHQSFADGVAQLGKLDNLYLESDIPLYSDDSLTIVLPNPVALELNVLADIRVTSRPTLTINDINGNEYYSGSPLIIETLSPAGAKIIEWRDINSKPNFTGWATKAFTDGSTTDVAEGSNQYFTNAKVKAYGDTVYPQLSVQYTNPTWLAGIDASTIKTGTIDLARLPAMPSANTIVCTTIPAMSAGDQLLVAKGTVVIESTTGNTYRYSGSGSVILNASYIQQSDMTPDWAVITNRPTNVSTWTNDAGYLTAASSLAWAKLTGVPATFAPSAHTHLWADLTDKPSTFTPSAHVHAIADTTGLQAALDAKQPTGAYILLTSPITGYAVGTNAALAATDTVLGAFNKIQAQLNGKQAGSSVLTSIATLSTGTGLVKLTNGTASLDTSTYATTTQLGAYLPIANPAFTGTLTGPTATFTGPVKTGSALVADQAQGGDVAGQGARLALIDSAAGTNVGWLLQKGSTNDKLQFLHQNSGSWAEYASLTRTGDLAISGKGTFGGLLTVNAYDSSTYTTPGIVGNWNSPFRWAIVGGNGASDDNTIGFRTTNASVVATGYANIAANNGKFGAEAAIGTYAGTGWSWTGHTGYNNSTTWSGFMQSGSGHILVGAVAGQTVELCVGQVNKLTASNNLVSIATSLAVNGAAMPAWGTGLNPIMLGGEAFLYSNRTAAGTQPSFGSNFYYDGSNLRCIATYSNTNYPRVLLLGTDGALNYLVSNTSPTAGAVITDINSKFSVDRAGNGYFAGNLQVGSTWKLFETSPYNSTQLNIGFSSTTVMTLNNSLSVSMLGSLSVASGLTVSGLTSVQGNDLRYYTIDGTNNSTDHAGIYPSGVTWGANTFAFLAHTTNTSTYLNASSSLELQITNGSKRSTVIQVLSNGINANQTILANQGMTLMGGKLLFGGSVSMGVPNSVVKAYNVGGTNLASAVAISLNYLNVITPASTQTYYYIPATATVGTTIDILLYGTGGGPVGSRVYANTSGTAIISYNDALVAFVGASSASRYLKLVWDGSYWVNCK